MKEFDTDLYLEVIGLKRKTPSLDFLNEIIGHHQKEISFNNLYVFYQPGEILNLDINYLFKKVVANREGGYCFENNKTFFYLLKELGFFVEAKSARVIYDNTGDVARTHRTTLVTINDLSYLADVGFGKDAPPFAVELNSNVINEYRILPQEDFYILQVLNGDEFKNLYTFDEGRYQESDFSLANYYTNTHPNSKFTKNVIITRRDGEMREFINNNIYSKIIKGVREDKVIEGQDEFDFYLGLFGINKSYDFSMINRES